MTGNVSLYFRGYLSTKIRLEAFERASLLKAACQTRLLQKLFMFCLLFFLLFFTVLIGAFHTYLSVHPHNLSHTCYSNLLSNQPPLYGVEEGGFCLILSASL